MANINDPRRNSEGYLDLTAYEAIVNIEREEEKRFKKLIRTILNICEMSGFRLEGRITVTDVRNGRTWR